MKALWLEAGRAELRELPRPAARAGEALVRVLCAGVCGTDLQLQRGYAAFAGVPGHEFVGRVEAATDAPQWLGRRVVGEINATCGACETCRRGHGTHCEHRSVLGLRGRPGAFAEWLCLPLANLHAVPDALADEQAVFVEPLAAALHVLDAVRPSPQDRVVVLGAGRLGVLVALALGSAGCDALVAARPGPRVRRLTELGLRWVDPALLSARQADVVVDCTGSPAGLEQARHLLRPRGTLVLKSTYAGEVRTDLSALVVDELTLVGSRCGAFPPALQALASGRVPVQALIDARYPLEQAPQALQHAARPGAFKVLIAPAPSGEPEPGAGTAA